jgi:MYXO-CTERM domain-containing protein
LPKPTSLPEESASCSCRAAGKPTNGQGLGALAALGLALFAVRRRRKTLS